MRNLLSKSKTHLQQQSIKLSLIITILCFSLLCINTEDAIAQTQNDRTQQLKVAFIFNIARYVKWPNYVNDTSIVNLCFIEQNPFNSAIQSINNKYFGNKRMSVKSNIYLNKKNNCQIIFLTQQQINNIALDMQNKTQAENHNRYSLLFDKNILIMGDKTNNAINTEELGPLIITLIRRGSNIGLNISIEPLNESNIKLSSQLLKLSRSN
ncbi:MAG: YfiR family protein [Pseudomonadota bacterium]